MNVLLFEDEFVSRLYPITTGRPAFTISCGSFRLLDWVEAIFAEQASASVRPHLQPLLQSDHRELCRSLQPTETWTLCLNARLVPGRANLEKIMQLATNPTPLVVTHGTQAIAAAIVPTVNLARSSLVDCGQVNLALQQFTRNLNPLPVNLELFDFPHDVIRFNQRIFDENHAFRLSGDRYREIADGVFVSGSVTISDFVVTNTKAGPILIEDDTAIGPFCFLRGPLYLGPRTRVNEHAAIKDYVSIGHTTKIGGEVESSVIEPFSNKQHHGFLGHSYLGSWINLGAGTCNSDLKNTYGEVKMDYSGERVPTGMQFIGCIIGDYSKTAINTSVFTGKTIGVCSMVYGFVTTNVPSFTNYARSFGQVTEMSPAVMEATQKRMFSRRNVLQRKLDVELLNSMHALTQKERQMAEEPLSL
jgi:UDP-N-acetylglucosamine diphosphorylase / glucose-1-phosphate thymidylyltransferase / UDP-N-acetylgalactosamine diphosphorylase / glucosamine-1-phosphate N-acetyltransferase / galactosamine-1-phosphate N-acetyltransferase